MNRLARWFVAIITLPMPEPDRTRYAEQFAADLDGARELGLSPTSVAFGAARTTAQHLAHQGDTMPLPIGPLALGIHLTQKNPRLSVVLAIILGMLLLAGVGLLVLR